MSTTPGLLEKSPASFASNRSFSPMRVLTILAILIYLAELVAMIILYFVELPNYLARSLLDGIIMMVLILPGLYFLQLKPLKEQMQKREKADQALRESEKLLRNVLEMMPVGVWVIDAKGNIQHGNPASEEIWGGARYVGFQQYGEYKGWWADSGKKIEPEEWAAARAITRRETSLNEEVKIETFDGKQKIILNSAVPIVDDQNSIQGVVIVNQDITQRREMEKTLIQTNELLEKVFFSIDTLIAYLDRDFNFVRVNETYAKGGGHPAEFYVGKNHFDLFPNEENQAIFQRVVETGEPFSVLEKPFEYAEFPEKGMTYWDWSLLPVKGVDGAVEGLVLSLVDITERKLAEFALARQNQELRALSEAERRQRDLAEGLARSVIALTSSLQLEDVLNTVLDQIRRAIPFRGADVMLMEGKTLRVAGYRGFEDIPNIIATLQRDYSLDQFPLLQQVCSNFQPLLLPDTLENADWVVAPGMEWVRSYLVVPLISEGQVTGFVNLSSEQPGFFRQETVEQMMAFAAPAALALHNAQLYKNELTARQTAETLSASALALAQTLDMDQVLHTLMEYIDDIVASDVSGVGLLDGEDRLAVRVAHGYSSWTGPDYIFTFPANAELDRLVSRIIRTQKSQLITDTVTYPLLIGDAEIEQIRNWLLAPLVSYNKTIGLVGLGKLEPGFFNQEHIQWVEALVAQAAVAIQNAWLFQQVRSSSERLQSLARKLVEVHENERYHVARELHDEAGQALSSLKLSLGRLEQDPDCPAHMRQRLEGLKDMTDSVLEELHRLAIDLRPIALDRLGLVAALEQFAKKLNSDRLSVQFKAVGFEGDRLPQDVETSLYRIVQEALSNVTRHAQASRVGILLARDAGKVRLFVEDDGIGFAPDLVERGDRLGLVGMRERAEMFGGSLTMESSPGKGTSVIVEVPDDNSNLDRG